MSRSVEEVDELFEAIRDYVQAVADERTARMRTLDPDDSCAGIGESLAVDKAAKQLQLKLWQILT